MHDDDQHQNSYYHLDKNSTDNYPISIQPVLDMIRRIVKVADVPHGFGFAFPPVYKCQPDKTDFRNFDPAWTIPRFVVRSILHRVKSKKSNTVMT